MPARVKVPSLSESVSEATLISWKKQPGDFVKRNDILAEIETDKIVMEIPAPVDGVLSIILEKEGASVVSDQDIAEINDSPSVVQESYSKKQESSQNAKTDVVDCPTAKVAMPAAVSTATREGVNLDNIGGSGLGGRILKEDVLNFKSSEVTEPKITEATTSKIAESAAGKLCGTQRIRRSNDTSVFATADRREPMSRLRARVAERLLESQSSTATLTTFNEVNMKAIIDLRKKYVDDFEKRYGVRLGFMSFFVKACVAALKRFPVLNASIDGSDIVYHGSFNIGVAVGTERGLVVPVIRNADCLLMHEIEMTVADYAGRAQSGRLTLEELSGGTFSISNGGAYGSMMSTPIINPPQSAILGVHGIKDRPIVERGEVVVRPMVYLALSYDHRLIDGREAVLGLVAIKDFLEDPSRLLLGI